MELEFKNVTFYEKGKSEYPRKTFQKERTNNKLKPHMALTPGLKPGPHQWEESVLTTVPPCQL